MSPRAVRLVVLVAALGYFVDIYDLILFGAVRRASLLDLGIKDPDQLLSVGIDLINWQMGGLLVGGLLWGVLGDRRGRLSVLFGSILTYSLANLANGLVETVPQYAAARFIAGVGLAGELGAGITLVAEVLGPKQRGWGTTVVAAVGISGGVAAAIVGGALPDLYAGAPWRTAYFIGGGLGLVLLALRFGVVESGLFARAQALARERVDAAARPGASPVTTRTPVAAGNFLALFVRPERARRYLAVVAVAVPIWFVVGILITFADALGASLGLSPAPVPATALLCCYGGLALGDLASGALSQRLRSRRRAIAAFLAQVVVATGLYLGVGGHSMGVFYACCAWLGFGAGYWAVFVTTAAEQFGTNLRATATTTAPNVVRGSVVPLTLAFKRLSPSLGLVPAALALGAVSLVVAFIALGALRETYGVDLDYLEE